MKRYIGESRKFYSETFDSYVNDCIYAEDATGAMRKYLRWIVEERTNHEELKDMLECRVKEVV